MECVISFMLYRETTLLLIFCDITDSIFLISILITYIRKQEIYIKMTSHTRVANASCEVLRQSLFLMSTYADI